MATSDEPISVSAQHAKEEYLSRQKMKQEDVIDRAFNVVIIMLLIFQVGMIASWYYKVIVGTI